MEYGPELRKLRNLAGVAQGDFAKRLGVSHSYLCKLETGQRPMTEAEFLRAKATLLDAKAERDLAFDQAKAVS